MTQAEHAKSILKKVLTALESISDQYSAFQHSGCYFVIPGNGLPRWIIPVQPMFGGPILAQWQPYGVLSRLKWKVLRLLYRLQVIKFIPGVYRITSINDKTLDEPVTSTEVVPVVYVGTPGLQQKAVVTLVNTRDANSLAVMKVALANGAYTSLGREAIVLKRLAHLGVTGVPQFVQKNIESECTLQTMLSGRPTSRKMSQLHIDWLLTLPKSEEVTTLDKQAEILRNLLELNMNQFSTCHKTILRCAIDTIKGQNEIPLVLVHGDFAPWNIKQQADRSLLVMDWEDARFDGLPLWDLCHFYFIQAHLFNEMTPISSLKSGVHASRYLNALGMHGSMMQMFSLLYCLFQILSGNNVSKEYKYFLFDQLSELCIR